MYVISIRPSENEFHDSRPAAGSTTGTPERGGNVITRAGFHCAPLAGECIDGGKNRIGAGLPYININTCDGCRIVAGTVREVSTGADPQVCPD